MLFWFRLQNKIELNSYIFSCWPRFFFAFYGCFLFLLSLQNTTVFARMLRFLLQSNDSSYCSTCIWNFSCYRCIYENFIPTNLAVSLFLFCFCILWVLYFLLNVQNITVFARKLWFLLQSNNLSCCSTCIWNFSCYGCCVAFLTTILAVGIGFFFFLHFIGVLLST